VLEHDLRVLALEYVHAHLGLAFARALSVEPGELFDYDAERGELVLEGAGATVRA
jgi:hypothetical protein